MVITDLVDLVNFIENNLDNLDQNGELIDGDVCLYTDIKGDLAVMIPVKLWNEYENKDRQYPFMSCAPDFDILGLNWFTGGEEDSTATSWIC